MIFYVLCEKSKAARFVKYLQRDDLENCYISPHLAFSNLQEPEFSAEQIKEIKLDLLQMCDELIIFGNGFEESDEIALAEKLKMEVTWIGSY